MGDTSTIVHLKEQLNNAIEQGDKNAEGSVQDSLGRAYTALEKYVEAIECYKQVANIAIELRVSIAEGRAYYNLGNASRSLANNEEAIGYYEQCLSVLQGNGDREIERMAYCNLGTAYFCSGNYTDAISYLEISLAEALEAEDRYVEVRACCNLGDSYLELGKFEKAVSYFEQSLRVASETSDSILAGKSASKIGYINTKLGNYKEAVKHYNTCLEYAIENKDKETEKIAYYNLGSSSYELRDYYKTIDYFEKNLEILKLSGDKKGEVAAYGYLGNAYEELGKYQEAVKYHKKSLNIAKEIADRNAEANSYEKIGDVYSVLGKYSEAIAYYDEFLNVSIEIKDKDRQQRAYSDLGRFNKKISRHQRALECIEKHLQIVIDNGDKLGQGQAYCNLGNVYQATGLYAKAINCYKIWLDIALQENDKNLASKAYCNLGNAHHELGNKQEAIDHYKKSANLAIECGDREAEGRANCLLGYISSQSGDYNKVIEYNKKHLDIVKMMGDKHGELLANRNLGSTCLSLAKYQEAIQCHQTSLVIAKQIGDRHGEGRANEYLGYVHQEMKDFKKAIEHYEKHLCITKDIDDKSGACIACGNIGIGLFNLYLIGKSCQHKVKCVVHNETLTVMKAEKYLKESLQWYDSMFKDLGEEDHYKISIEDKFLETYKVLTELCIETGQSEKAMLVSERKRGRALEDILAVKYNLERKEKSMSEFLGYVDIESKVLSSNSCILFFSDLLRLTRNNNESAIGTWVFDLENHVSFFRNEFQELKVLLQQTSFDEDIQMTKDILPGLVDKVYTTMSVRGAAGICENRSLNIHENGATEGDASTSQDPKRDLRCAYDEDLDEDYLEVLFDALITPVQHKLTHDEIVIVPDGPLFKVPFAALRDQKTKLFLSETKRIRIVPSLTTLKMLKQSSADSHSMTGALIVGDPDVTGKRMLKGKLITLSPLPNARLEADTIGRILGVTAITGAQATKEAIKQRLREGVAVIHFATHGCADRGEIVLTPSATLSSTKTIPEEEDYLLTVNEVQEIGLKARLVVLSCCHSGRGEIKSEGVVGMSRAFLAAGALAVVACLWAVDDLGTRVFMESFYTHLKQGRSASTSLQLAMKEMRNMTRYNKPMFWAPFVLIGDDVKVSL